MISGRNTGNDTYHSALSIEDTERLEGATALVEGLSDIVQHDGRTRKELLWQKQTVP